MNVLKRIWLKFRKEGMTEFFYEMQNNLFTFNHRKIDTVLYVLNFKESFELNRIELIQYTYKNLS